MPRQQQQAYAELYQQTHAQPAAQERRARPASPATHGRSAAAVTEGAGGAAPAPARGRAGRLPGASATGSTQRPSSPGKLASASALTSQKPTRIPMHAGGSLPQPPAAAAEQPAARAEQPATATPAAPSTAAAAAATPAGVGCTAASGSSHPLAAANGSLGGASTSASATHQVMHMLGCEGTSRQSQLQRTSVLWGYHPSLRRTSSTLQRLLPQLTLPALLPASAVAATACPPRPVLPGRAGWAPAQRPPARQLRLVPGQRQQQQHIIL